MLHTNDYYVIKYEVTWISASSISRLLTGGNLKSMHCRGVVIGLSFI